MLKQIMQTRLAVFIIVLFLGGMWASCNELKYAIWGRTAQAELFEAKIKTFSSRGGKKQVYKIRYRWTDPDDGKREDKMTKSADWSPPSNGMIEIEYMPGIMKSRAAGNRNWFALGAFALMCGAILFLFVKAWREGTRKR